MCLKILDKRLVPRRGYFLSNAIIVGFVDIFFAEEGVFFYCVCFGLNLLFFIVK
jgi:hypothetical protein